MPAVFYGFLSDFALFLSVMKNCEAHRNVLSIITGEPDLNLRQIRVEEVVLNRRGRRARYYQSLLDAPFLKSGKIK